MKTTAAFFEMLGAPMLARSCVRGRRARAGGEWQCISHGLWVRRFGGVGGAIGEDMVLNGERYTIVGVLPDRFVTPVRDADVMVPFVREQDPRREVRDSRFLRLIGRLRPDVSASQAQADLERSWRAAQGLSDDQRGDSRRTRRYVASGAGLESASCAHPPAGGGAVRAAGRLRQSGQPVSRFGDSTRSGVFGACGGGGVATAGSPGKCSSRVR